MKLAALLTAAALVLVTRDARAQQLPDLDSGNGLLEICTSRQPFRDGYCLGYITGVVRGSDAQRVLQGSDSVRGFCIPDGVTRMQVRDVVVRALEDDPRSRHWPSSGLVLLALTDAFPCRPK